MQVDGGLSNSKMNLFTKIFCAILCLDLVFSYEPILDFIDFQDNYPEVKLSENCSTDFARFKHGIKNREIWAKLVQDVSGRDTPGLLRGNNFWMGFRDSCNLMNNPIHVPLYPLLTRKTIENVTDIRSEIEVEYRMFYVNHSSEIQFNYYGIYPFYGLYIGLCFPKRCSQSDADAMAEKVFNISEFKDDAVHGDMKFYKSKRLELREGFFRDPFVIALM